ncbi:PilZ domain-containing protein [bacterium]|nr:PilZ domain-containing protein [bacterium]
MIKHNYFVKNKQLLEYKSDIKLEDKRYIMDERRKEQRIDAELPVTLRCRGRLIPATALNISCGGACLQFDNSLVEEHDRIEVIVDLENHKRDVALSGEVVRKQAQDSITVGVKFTNLFTIAHKSLEEFIKKNLH